MQRRHFVLFAVPLLVVASGAFTEARAEAWWHVVGDVRIGGVHFSVGTHGRSHDGYGDRTGHYYRTRHRLSHRGARCSSFCYREQGYDYHHASCPVFAAHATHYGYVPAPRYMVREHVYDDGYYVGRGHKPKHHRHHRHRRHGRRGHPHGRW